MYNIASSHIAKCDITFLKRRSVTVNNVLRFNQFTNRITETVSIIRVSSQCINMALLSGPTRIDSFLVLICSCITATATATAL